MFKSGNNKDASNNKIHQTVSIKWLRTFHLYINLTNGRLNRDNRDMKRFVGIMKKFYHVLKERNYTMLNLYGTVFNFSLVNNPYDFLLLFNILLHFWIRLWMTNTKYETYVKPISCKINQILFQKIRVTIHGHY